jgi:hypothetical protein
MEDAGEVTSSSCSRQGSMEREVSVHGMEEKQAPKEKSLVVPGLPPRGPELVLYNSGHPSRSRSYESYRVFL